MKWSKIEDIKDAASIELLKELHILTRDGNINQDSRRKLKQVSHLVQFIEPFLTDLVLANTEINLVDHGAGKSYLGFILYNLFFKDLTLKNHLYGIETRPALIEKSISLQNKLGFKNMSFLNLSVAESIASDQLPEHVQVVTALHACDTATDEAIDFAIAKNSKYVVLVPCCQAEVSSNLRSQKAQKLANPLAEIYRHPLHTREFGSHLTNVLRCLRLEAYGYQVTVTEFTGLEHSMKNELILAKKIEKFRPRTADRLQSLLSEFGLQNLKSRFNTEIIS